MTIKAEYIDHLGNDDRIVDAARVSFDKQASNYTKKKNEKLIKYLARKGHWTPFGHGQITLRESVPIFVARQRFKHTVGFVYNEVSRRYVDDKPEFYTPDAWRARATDKKQGSSEEVVSNPDYCDQQYGEFLGLCETLYNLLLHEGVAPEQARMVLPQSMYTSYYCTGSLAAWARAYKLRSDFHAQKEIQELSKQWNEIIKPLFPISWAALVGLSSD